MHALVVGGSICLDEFRDLFVAKGLSVTDQGDGGSKALEVPGEGADVGLVEVIDVENKTTLGVHVGTEVLRMQIAMDPDAAGALVEEGTAVLLLVEVVVEETGRAAVKGEGGGGHLAELALERGRVAGEEIAKGVVEHLEDLVAALLDTQLRQLLEDRSGHYGEYGE